MIEAVSPDRVRTLLELDRDEQARELVSRLLVDDPDDPELLCMLAQACLGTHDPAAAARAADAAVRYAPQAEWPLRLGALAQARLGHGVTADETARRAVELDPDNWRTHYVRAQVGVQFGTAEAEPAAREAVRLDPGNADCHEVLGDVLLAQHRPAEASRAYGEALRLDPDHVGARHGLALVHSARGDLGRAAAGFAATAAADPADQRAVANLIITGVRALAAVHWIVWYTSLGSAFLALEGDDRRAAVVGFGVMAVALVGGAVLTLRGARTRAFVLVRSIAGRDTLLALWGGLLLLAVVFFGVAAFGPPSWESWAFVLAFAAQLSGALVCAVRARR